MATQEHLARNRARMLAAIMGSLQTVGKDAKVPLPALPALLRLQDQAHREFALIRWVHDSFVAVGLLDNPVYPEKPAALTPATPTQTPPGDEDPDGADLTKLTKEKLLVLVKERNITTVTSANTKTEIIAALTPATPTQTSPPAP